MQKKKNHSGYEPIENYGIIGNLHTVALVSIKGSIDFMCPIRYDMPTVFASLLECDYGGNFSIEPMLNEIKYKQIYLPDTAILITRFLSNDGIAEVTDFMPVVDNEHHCILIRKVKTIKGCINYKLRCSPRFNYSTSRHNAFAIQDGVQFTSGDELKNTMLLTSEFPISIKNGDAYSTFTLDQSETTSFIMQFFLNGDDEKYYQQINPVNAYERTIQNMFLII
jgi:GH15 family glucan-1,4-alpha-glucosidase